MPVSQDPLREGGQGLPSRWTTWRHGILWTMAGCTIALPVWAGDAPSPTNSLVRMVRQDCGSCHGMLLTGGLGPALTPAALKDKPLDSLVATIMHGRPGTPMPGWKAMLSDDDARWIAQQLQAGFPHE